ncbi:MAG: MTAP family purine nucleoside phosphorylase [Pleomorphochaeta sp.]
MNAIIGGTGIDEFFPDSKIYEIDTKYGKAEYLKKDNIIIILRHGLKHSLPPHLINYRANVEALRLLGVEQCIGIYSVGSISKKLLPGGVTIISDFIDFTNGQRESTFSCENDVFHNEMTSPFNLSLKVNIKKEASLCNFPLDEGGVYICTNGPRLETPAEIRMFDHFGADFVGMTGCPEFSLLSEAKIKYVSLAYSINWASGVNQDKITFLETQSRDKIAQAIISFCIRCFKITDIS